MRLNQRFLAVGFATTIGLGVLAPMASAKDHGNRDLAIGLGAASVALLATHNDTAGAVGIGLTLLAADSCGPRHPVVVCAPRYQPNFPRFDRRENHRDDHRDRR